MIKERTALVFPSGAAAHPEEAGGADYPAGTAGEGELPQGEGQPGRHAAQGTMAPLLLVGGHIFLWDDVSGDADVSCPVSRRRRKTSARWRGSTPT